MAKYVLLFFMFIQIGNKNVRFLIEDDVVREFLHPRVRSVAKCLVSPPRNRVTTEGTIVEVSCLQSESFLLNITLHFYKVAFHSTEPYEKKVCTWNIKLSVSSEVNGNLSTNASCVSSLYGNRDPQRPEMKFQWCILCSFNATYALCVFLCLID
jgi:hypothetical protein